MVFVNLNNRQKEAIETLLGPALIIAGAGSGKTRVMIERILELINSGVQASQIIALSFTNKAANEMRQRIQDRLSKTLVSAMTLSTIHSFGLEILRKYSESLSLDDNFRIISEQERLQILNEIISENNLKDIFTLQKLSQKISYLKDSLFDNEKFDKEDNIFDKSILKSIFEKYNNKLRILSLVDFDDLVYLPVLLFKTHPHILALLQKKGLYILVDEFQDTSFSQFEFLKILSSQDKNIFAVGDDDQSIYSWRGSYPQVLKNFLEYFEDSKLIKLEQNYRSAEYILNFANDIIACNKDRILKKLWTSSKIKSCKIVLYEAESERDEGDFVVNNIKEKLKENSFETIGVLMRSNSQVKTFEKVLREHNISYSKSFKDDITDNRDVQNLLAYLKLLYNERDLISFSKVISAWKNTLTDNENLKKIKSLLEEYPKKSLIDIIETYFQEKENLYSFAKTWKKIKHECRIDEKFEFGDFIAKCFSVLGYKNSILLSSSSMRSAKKRIHYLDI